MAEAREAPWADLRLSAARPTLPAAERFVASLRGLHANGGACFASFRFPGTVRFLTAVSRGELIASGFFDHLWQTDAVRRTLPEVAADPGFQCKLPFVRGNPFTLDGELATALFFGGAYGDYKGTAADARAEAATPAAELLGSRFERSLVFTNHGPWCDYFLGMVDWSWVVFDTDARLIHVLCATDWD